MNQTSELYIFNNEQVPLLSPDTLIEHRCQMTGKKRPALPPHLIMAFFPNLYAYSVQHLRPRIIDWINKPYPYHIFEWKGHETALICPGMGAPLAAALLEESIALGVKQVIFFGMAGLLRPGIGKETIIIPQRAIRDEGVSFHYRPASRTVEASLPLTEAVEKAVRQTGTPLQTGLTWTTDALYRETPQKVRRLEREGAITVEMEAASLFAVAASHGMEAAGFFTLSDSLAKDHWTPFTGPGNPLANKPVKLFKIAAEAFSLLSD